MAWDSAADHLAFDRDGRRLLLVNAMFFWVIFVQIKPMLELTVSRLYTRRRYENARSPEPGCPVGATW